MISYLLREWKIRKAWRDLERIRRRAIASYEVQDYRRRREAALKHTRAI